MGGAERWERRRAGPGAAAWVWLLALGDGAAGTTVPSPRFSWETLPAFLHTQNTTNGGWNPAAAARVAQYPLSYSGMTGMRQPDGSMISLETAAPAMCRRISALNSTTHTFSYVNSVIDWPWNYKLHAGMVANPSWRLKHDNGSDWLFHGQFIYNLSNPALRQSWIATCIAAVDAGCTGCFIDQSNDVENGFGHSPAAEAYSRDHLATLVELNAQLQARGKYAINNHLGDGGDHVRAMMIEDFAGSEKCIRLLQTVAARGIIAEVHAGNEFAGSKTYACANNGTDALAAFLIGAGNYSYYHCTDNGFSTRAAWPAVRDEWLDPAPEHGFKLGEPLGPATLAPSQTGANASVWRRAFASGTRVEFDGGNGNGTIWWADGPVQVGGKTASVNPTVATIGCRWETDKPAPAERRGRRRLSGWGDDGCPEGYAPHAAGYWQDSVPGPPTHPAGADTANGTLVLCATKCSTYAKRCLAFELSTPAAKTPGPAYCFIFLDPLALPFVPLGGNVTTCVVDGYPPSPPPQPARLRLRSVFQSGMVLQAGASTTIFGDYLPCTTSKHCAAGTAVLVALDAVAVGQSAVTAAGTFAVPIGAHAASLTPRIITVSVVGNQAADPVTLTNVLFGEQYICAGQSNMELTVAQCNNASAEIAAANHPFIRLAQVRMVGSMATPQADASFSIPWTPTTPRTVASFSALCYYFGREMFARLGGGTPVGLVEAAVGGTYIQAFSTPEANAACNNTGRRPPGWVPCPPQKPGTPPYVPWGGANTPSALWNSMVHPLTFLGFRLAVWDQAEENLATDEAGIYTCLQDELVRAWRSYWGAALSFHLVQLPSFNYTEFLWIYESPLGQMRLSQQATASDLPGVTRAVTIDLADLRSPYTSVHNRQKQEVARRVALNALATAYHRAPINTGPVVAGVAFWRAQHDLLVRVSSALPGVGTFNGSAGCVACCEQSPFEIETETATARRRDGVTGPREHGTPAATSWARVTAGTPFQSNGPGVNIPVRVGAATPLAIRYGYDADVQCVYFDADGLPLAPFALGIAHGIAHGIAQVPLRRTSSGQD